MGGGGSSSGRALTQDQVVALRRSSPSAAVKVAALIERYEDVAVVLWPPRFLQRYTLAPMLRRARARGKAPNGAPVGS